MTTTLAMALSLPERSILIGWQVKDYWKGYFTSNLKINMVRGKPELYKGQNKHELQLTYCQWFCIWNYWSRPLVAKIKNMSD